ncbi:hypothetical protein DFP72DRAFT_1174159 [Ephemerocybe angulata]|uniref:F-box domain-containing protein n=1 Tax=Ephemerocybe angulata TaxID=980116 RepID=A0A8H6M170_9AGAR|nr:hypothetical protein DFP72DRAFT_1174159 [Tulosesus angulatus]
MTLPRPPRRLSSEKPSRTLNREAAAPSLRIPIRVLNSRLQEYRPILSPLRHVPLDVLGEIFAHAFTLEKSARLMTPSYQKLLPRVSRVCRSWREASLRTPEPWRCMTINQRWGPGPPLAVVDAWIKRSGCVPRTLVFISNKCGKYHCLGAGECYLSNPAFQTLLQEGSPLDSLTVECGNILCFYNLIPTLGGDAQLDYQEEKQARPWDRLRALSIRISSEGGCEWPDNDKYLLFASLPPSVRSFELWLPRITLAFPGRMTSKLKFPESWLKNLTSITLKNDWEPEHLFDILEECINAEEVKIVPSSIIVDWRVDSHPVLRRMADSGLLLPKLKSFCMITNLKWFGFVRQLKMPLLEDLTLPFYSEQQWPRPSTENVSALGLYLPFAEFIGNVSRIAESTLRRVKIANNYLHKSILLDILYASPAGAHLILKNVSFDDSAIADDVTNPHFDQALHLGIVMLENAQDDHENLKKFVENRGSRFTVI